MRTPRLPRWLRRKPQRPATGTPILARWQRPRRAQLRTRVLAGVLAVTAGRAGRLRLHRGHRAAPIPARPDRRAAAERPQPVPGRRRHAAPSANGSKRARRPEGRAVQAGRSRTCTSPAADCGRRPGRTRASTVLGQYYVRVSAPILAESRRVVGGKPADFIKGTRLIPRMTWPVLAYHRAMRPADRAQRTAAPAPARRRQRTGRHPRTSPPASADVDSTVGRLELILAIGLGRRRAGRGRGHRPGAAPRPAARSRRMAGQADRITAGDLTDRVSPQDPGTEVGRLGAALNGMLARIEASVRSARPARNSPGASSPTPATSCATRWPRCAPTPSSTSRAPCAERARSTRRCAASRWRRSG